MAATGDGARIMTGGARITTSSRRTVLSVLMTDVPRNMTRRVVSTPLAAVMWEWRPLRLEVLVMLTRGFRLKSTGPGSAPAVN